MNTTIFFTRHTISISKDIVNNIKDTDSHQVSNEKAIASVDGEQLALKMSKLEDLSCIDVIYSSNYARAISTAKYIAAEKNLKINVDEDLGERKFGIESWNGFPNDFGKRQFEDADFKIGNGESRRIVQERMTKCINKVLKTNRGKNISIVTHSTALVFYLMQYMDVKFEDSIYWNNEKICDYKIPNCGTIAVTYNDKNEIIRVKPINYEVQPLIEGKVNEICDNLVNQGFRKINNSRIIANYYLKKDINIKDTSELKNYCVRIRKIIKNNYINGFALGNYKQIQNLHEINSNKMEVIISDEEAINIEEILLNNNYKLVYTDDKTDNVFIKDNLIFQIQDLEGIGLTNAAIKIDSIDISDDITDYLYSKMDEFGIKYKHKKNVNRFSIENNNKKYINEIISIAKKI